MHKVCCVDDLLRVCVDVKFYVFRFLVPCCNVLVKTFDSSFLPFFCQEFML